MKWRAASAVYSTMALGVFMAMAWLGERLLPLGPLQVWIFRGVWALLALVTAFLIYRLTSTSAPKKKSEPDPEEAALDLVRKRLRASRGKKAAPGRLPMVLLLGPQGSTKTTLMSRSGVGAELLAGETHRGDDVVPTEAVNVWLGQGTLFVEVAASLMADEDRWKRLFRRIRPARLRAALARGEQAPRLAVVCVSCETLYRAAEGRGATEAAKELRERLVELAQGLGIRLPVYVLFTRADQLPHFTDYVRNLSDEEAQEILGATLTVPEVAEPGDHVPRETGRLKAAFDELFRSLARRRLRVLDREHGEQVRLGAYEFPREFRKLSEPAVKFLVELCRPTQLGVSPFLRGFYFTGVRPVVVRDAAAPPPSERSEPRVAMGATSVFDPSQMLRPETPAPAGGGEGRRIPQWVFLERVFRRVVLGDEVARAVTAGGRRVEGLRRLLVGSAAAVLAVLAIGMTTSFFNNRALVREATTAAASQSGAAVRLAGPATADELASLERLRDIADRVGAWDREGRPLGLRWGLWSGDEIHPELRRRYFDRFESLLWRSTRSTLVGNLRALPPEPGPGADYRRTYEELKAYLVATAHPQRSTTDFMTPVLHSRWQSAAAPDQATDSLARLQFDFFARELPRGNPYDDPADPQLLDQAREYLLQFSGQDQLYEAMLQQASSELPAVRFADVGAEAGGLVSNDQVVPGAFTADGWELVHENLENVRDLFAREEWVLGEGRTLSDADLDRVAGDLRARYRDEYVDRWTGYLASSSVSRFRSTGDAANKLRELSGNQSPLLQLLFQASRHTNVDTVDVGPVFQPLHHVAPPGVTDRYITESTQGYADALGRLQASMERLANAQGAQTSEASAAAIDDAAGAERSVQQISRTFVVEGPAVDVGESVQRLLDEPIRSAEAIARSAGPARARAQLNEAGARFCRIFEPLSARFPFSRGAAAEASPEDVDAVFRPGSGELWRFYEESLSDVLVERGSRYEAREGLVATPSPTFVSFFNRLADFSESLYAGGEGPSLAFDLRILTTPELPAVTFSMDGRSHTYTQTNPASVYFQWDAARGRVASVSGRVDGQEVDLVDGEPLGTWALFRLFQVADWEQQGPGRHLLRWTIPGRNLTVTAELRMEGAMIFDRSFTSGLGCVSNVAR